MHTERPGDECCARTINTVLTEKLVTQPFGEKKNISQADTRMCTVYFATVGLLGKGISFH